MPPTIACSSISSEAVLTFAGIRSHCVLAIGVLIAIILVLHAFVYVHAVSFFSVTHLGPETGVTFASESTVCVGALCVYVASVQVFVAFIDV